VSKLMQIAWTDNQIGRLNGRIVIVTGANTGLGLRTAEVMASKGAKVVLACRNADKAETAAKKIKASHPKALVEFLHLDLSSLASVRNFAADFSSSHTKLHVLLNNAGVMIPPFSTTEEGLESQFGINHLGHFALTGLLLPVLRATPGARVVNVSSVAHRDGKLDLGNLRGEKGYKPFREYSQSKLANLLFTFELHRRLRAAGIANLLSVAAHPGMSQTEIMRHSKFMLLFSPLVTQSIKKGAWPLLYAATHMDVNSANYIGPARFFEYWGHPKKVGCSRQAKAEDAAIQLWEMSEELSDVRFDFS
jgi:NAD(P)-dependent dehydrogenase (short-subunit alcohol dehydrogenase family)